MKIEEVVMPLASMRHVMKPRKRSDSLTDITFSRSHCHRESWNLTGMPPFPAEKKCKVLEGGRMTYRILATTTAVALALATSAQSQSVDANSPVDMKAETSTAGANSQTEATASVNGEATADGSENILVQGAEAVEGAVEETYSAGSDISAKLDAALTSDAVVMSKDGDVIGTVSDMNKAEGRVRIDFDGEMESYFDRQVEGVIMPVQSLKPGEEGLVLAMNRADLVAAVQSQVSANAEASK
ncbi:hypothetical protein [Aestuariicoccus sp. MJ-SS9]|uniref:hypothetical protein n=1 Tax=Aestuariicoccus sp. MJ-SS9 TaxID=3079855 RepID=UPI0029111818|nr:hypothetical protein [Aestuariicoccus sp. MJ-SS9]MDU8912515.1 hypothetical protein [Aestuariicoccus sp. MJ-SS9]